MSTLRFILRTDKVNQDGLTPIDLVYQIKGDRRNYSTKEKIRAENWDGGKKQQQAVYLDKKTAGRMFPDVDYKLMLSAKEVEDVNSKLAKIKSHIAVIEKRFELDSVPYDVAMVIAKLKEQPGT